MRIELLRAVRAFAACHYYCTIPLLKPPCLFHTYILLCRFPDKRGQTNSIFIKTLRKTKTKCILQILEPLDIVNCMSMQSLSNHLWGNQCMVHLIECPINLWAVLHLQHLKGHQKSLCQNSDKLFPLLQQDLRVRHQLRSVHRSTSLMKIPIADQILLMLSSLFF